MGKMAAGTANSIRGRLSRISRAGGKTSARIKTDRGARLATAKVNLTKMTDTGTV
jgi:hypothetical protein